MIDQASFQPDWVSPPGDTIEDLLEEKGWTKAELANRMGFTAKHVNELVKGRASLTADTAGRLSRVLGSTPRFWLTREAQYRAALERRQTLESASAEIAWLKELPLAWMKKQGWVEAAKAREQQVLECLKFFGVASVRVWRDQYERPLVAFRASEKFEKKIGAVSAWLRQGEITAAARDCAAFNRTGFKTALSKLRALTNEEDPSVFIPRMEKLCAAQGVAVVLIPAPPGCPVSGATRWLTKDKALLQLSLRYKSNDHLWFTFFHEAAHLLEHRKKLLFIELVGGFAGKMEEEADRFASDWLIPPRELPALRRLAGGGRASKAAVRQFAAKLGVAPGIVVGRLQKEGWLPWTHLNGLKVRYTWSD